MLQETKLDAATRNIALTSEATLSRAFAAQSSSHRKATSIASVNCFLAGRTGKGEASGKKFAENLVVQAVAASCRK